MSAYIELSRHLTFCTSKKSDSKKGLSKDPVVHFFVNFDILDVDLRHLGDRRGFIGFERCGT